LGLLIGGVLSGQSLIRAAELRSVSTEYSRYVTAVQSFRDKYFAIPGDMNNATSFWGAADPTPATCLTTVGTGTQTCNGNGDGSVLWGSTGSQRSEWYMFWQHLTNAGLIEGSYSGMSGSVAYDDTSSANVPRSKLNNSLWFVANDATSGGALFPVAVARHNFRIGGLNPGTNPSTSIMKPEELWNIDTKLDDGKPGLGVITSFMNGYAGTNCASTAVASTAVYSLNVSSLQCMGYFGTGF
jgi:hypothetical protein